MDGQVNYIFGKKSADGECSMCQIFEVGDDEEAPALIVKIVQGKKTHPISLAKFGICRLICPGYSNLSCNYPVTCVLIMTK